MKKQFKILVAYFLIFLVSSSFGQIYELTRYAENNGLYSRMIRGTFQDSEGFLWIAGNNGLFRFDTQNFKSYYSAVKDTTGLRGNRIICATQTFDKKIWVATDKGLHFIENDHIVFRQLLKNSTNDENYILSIFEDNKQNLWVGTYGGLFVIEKLTDTTIFISEKNRVIPKGAVWGISQDKKNRIWFCTNNEVFVSASENNFRFRKLKINTSNEALLKKAYVFKIQEFNENLLLISSGAGLLKGIVENDSTLNISNFTTNNGKTTANYFIEDFLIDSNRNIWIATWKNYFKKYKVANNNLIEQNVFLKSGFENMSANVLSVYEDSQKNIWLSNANGLFKLSEDKANIFQFPPSHLDDCFSDGLSVNALIEDKGNHLWIANNSGLYRFNKLDILQRNCPTDYLFIENRHFNFIHNLFIDSKNRLWVTSQKGISIAQLDKNFNPGKFFNITNENGLPHNWSFEVYEQDKSNFWVANYIRLLKISFKNDDLTNLEIKAYDSSRDRPDALVNSFTQDIQQDSNKNLWIGTFSGLSKLISEKDSGYFSNYTSKYGDNNKISNNAIKQIFLDKSKRLWIGTQTGLNLYRETTDDFFQFGKNDGLPAEYIMGIQEDSYGFLWIATTNGIMKVLYNDSTNTFSYHQYFSSKDGLVDNVTNKNALLIDNDDNVFIGSSKGLSVYPNSKISSSDKRIFKVALTSFKTTQEQIPNFISVKNRILENTIELSHFENSIQLQYTALDFTNIKFNKYRHKFLPVNKNWIETGNTSELTYYNISPGEYDLILDGSNNEGAWSGNPIHLKVIVNPPFWKSNLAFLFYGLLIVGLLSMFHFSKIRKRKRELTRELNHKKALMEEREQLRQENTADFHDELGSKVTKVSLFLTLAERSLKNNEDPTPWLSKIRNNTIELSDTFRDLLWVIDPKKDTLGDTLLRLKDFGENLFNNTGIDFRTTGFSLDKTNYMLDPQTKKQVVLIFKEAMNNCVKYSDCKDVKLNIQSTELYSKVELVDNGIGFDRNLLNDNKGRGLKNMESRAKKMKAELSIIASPQNGTTIRLSNIPHLVDDILNEDE
ncbi:MAG: hypothetical protein GY936_14575 [Ignavibacteriae bacterium]|nr:hypothetical protein [Ignavibacteriota bacterium]